MLARPMLVVAAVLVAVAAPHALAQSASVQAQSLFDEGRALIKAGKVAEACTAFEGSQKLDPAVTTLLNLAECREQNHQLATAWGIFVDANRMARANNNDKLARVATSHARKLEPRLSKLMIAVPTDRQIPGLEVLRDKDLVNPASWNHAIPIDGGTYIITARAPGRTPWTASRTVKVEDDLLVVEIPRLTDAAAPPAITSRSTTPGRGPAAGSPAGATGKAGAAAPAAPRPAAPSGPAPPSTSGARSVPPPAAVATARPGGERPAALAQSSSGPAATPAITTPPTPSTVDRRSRIAGGGDGDAGSSAGGIDRPQGARSRVWPIALGAGAVALGGTAIAFEISGRNLYDEAKDITDVPRQTERDSKEQSANSRHKVAQGLGIAALGCAGAAVYLLLRTGGEDRSSATAIAPLVSPQLAGLAVAGSW